jgi:tetratricopeptide (TPR) repeat protein
MMLAAAAAAMAAPQEEGKRIALIIGNNAYSISPLQNAVNDARTIEKALKDAGFKTILRENASKAAMEEATAEFLQQLGPDDTALFYYAGHGIQIENENFLVPVDFEAASSVIQAKFRCFSMAQVFEALKNRPKRTIIILDACRSNPVAQSQSLQSGLAQPQNAGKETYIAFSTSPGQVAADNPNGRNSWFTEALADLLTQPGLSLEEISRRVGARVSAATENRQIPWNTSTVTTRFYFHPPTNAEVESDPSVAEKWMEEARRREQREDWAEAIDLMNRVLQKKAGGSVEAAANGKLPYLMERRDGQAAYEAHEFDTAAAHFEKALKLDPFAVEGAFAGVDSYLIGDKLPEAVRLLKAIRVRGATADIEKANAMLKELATVYPAAGEELKAGIPQPPDIAEVFSGVRFGVPDWSAGQRYLQATPVPVSRAIKDLTDAFPPPAPVVVPAMTPVTPSDAQMQVAQAIFHMEVVPSADTRDIQIKRIGEQQFGFVQLDGPAGETPVVYNGRTVSQQVPVRLQLPVGKYEIRAMKDGQILGTQGFEVTLQGTSAVTVKR